MEEDLTEHEFKLLLEMLIEFKHPEIIKERVRRTLKEFGNLNLDILKKK